MHLLIDTQVLTWLLTGDRRLRQAWIDAFADPATAASISSVTAWEFSDLRQRGRLPVEEDIADFQALYGFDLLDFPADCWAVASGLPDIHRDPVDRMLVAHAIAGGFTLVSAGGPIRHYPVNILW